MLLDFRKIFASCDAPITRDLSLDLSNEDFGGYSVANPVNGTLTVVREGSAIKLDISVKASITAQCARCLDDVREDVSFSNTFFIREDEWAVDDPDGNNLPFNNEGKLDVQELVYSELMLEVPTVLLCSEDCQGLCPNCGGRKPCSCKCETNDTIDARLYPLQQLLTD